MVLLSHYSYEFNVPQGPTLLLISTIHVPYRGGSRILGRKGGGGGGGGRQSGMLLPTDGSLIDKAHNLFERAHCTL